MRTIAFLLVVFCLNSFSQSGLKEFKKTINAYNAIKQMTFDVEVYAYEKPTSKTPQPLGKGFAKKQEGSYFSSFGDTEMLQLQGKTLMINKEEKQINFYEYDMEYAKAAMINFNMDEMLDSLAADNDSLFIYKGFHDGYHHYVKKTPEEMIMQTDFYTDPKTNLINKVIYYYSQSSEEYEVPVSSIAIYYKNVKLDPTPLAYFSLDKFISKKGIAYIGNGNYKGYKVVHHKSKHKS